MRLGSTSIGPDLALTRQRTERWLLVAATCFVVAVGAFRGVERGIVLTDSARHAMNGALIHDWLVEGPWLAPGAYASWYYAHWPALSLGYHPPVFPVIEAMGFFVVGVGAFGARLVVTLATALSVLLLYRLVLATHKSPSVALLTAALFFALPLTQQLSQQVMLEMPALVFVLAALLALPRDDEPFTTRRGIVFALFAATAIWTKQLSVFLGAVPVIAAIVSGRRDWLRSKAMWGSVAACALALLALTAFELAFGPASPRRFAIFRGLPRVLTANTSVYLDALLSARSLAVLVGFVALGGMATVYRTRWRTVRGADALYWAWLVSMMAALMLGKWNSPRYLFLACPALVALTAVTAHRLLNNVLSPEQASRALTAAAVGVFGLSLVSAAPVLAGPAEAARLVAADHPTRVLYAGESDGHFVFELRSAGDDTNRVVIRGERLSGETYSSAAFEEFATRYGVSHVVLEDIRRFGVMPWTALIANPSPSMVPLGQIRVSGYRSGVLHVYRFTSRAADPQDVLTLPAEEGNLTSLALDWSTPSWRRTGAGAR